MVRERTYSGWAGVVVFLLLGCMSTSGFAQESKVKEETKTSSKLDVLSPEKNPLLRGDMFYYGGDYYRAISEYKLVLMQEQNVDVRDRIRLKIAWMYAQSSKNEASASLLKQIIIGRPAHDKMTMWARLYYGDVAYKAKRSSIAKNTYERLLLDCDDKKITHKHGASDEKTTDHISPKDCALLKAQAHMGLARHWIGEHKFLRAVGELEKIPSEYSQAKQLKEVARHLKTKTLQLPSKNPWVAGSLSVVPGLGHFYIEEYGAGVVAMIWNGAFIYALVDSILDQKYGQAALIGLVELVWYSGTIFGAVAGAQRFNRDAKRIVEQGVLQDMNRLVPVSPWPTQFPHDGGFDGLKLELEFSF